MSWLRQYLTSSLGKKHCMAVSGLLLCGFLAAHLAGNMLLLVSAEAFNLYAYKLTHNPLIIPMEVGLGLLFLWHIFLGMRLVYENRKARGGGYYYRKPSPGGSTFASRTMPYTGLIILVFLISHIMHFRFGPHYSVVYDGLEMRDLYKLVLETYQSIPMVLWYVFSSVCVGIHTSHGFGSAFQSIGFNHLKYTPIINTVSKVYGVVIALGFSILPLALYLKGAQ